MFHYQGSFWILISVYLLVACSATSIVYWRGFCLKFLGFGGGEGNSAHISRLMKHSLHCHWWWQFLPQVDTFTKGISACRGTQSDFALSLMETIPGAYGSLHREFSVHGLCSGADFILPLVETVHVTNGAFTKGIHFMQGDKPPKWNSSLPVIIWCRCS